ncbi:MAG: putative MAPEG superfamily protein [Hyphomicrobiaceae bacterium]|jgi:uncharacterized MAPEG superfamily protein
MTTPFICLAIVAAIPYVLAGTAGYFKAQQFGALDNNNPRIQALGLEGIGARAWAAQSNAWEALALFTVAVFVAHLSDADPEASATAAMIFAGTRVAHAAAYLADQATLRTLVFLIGLACIVRLFLLASA